MPGNVEGVLPLLHSIGFDFVHPVDPDHNDLRALRRSAAGKIALVGGFPDDLLLSGPVDAIQARGARSVQAGGHRQRLCVGIGIWNQQPYAGRACGCFGESGAGLRCRLTRI